MQRDALSISSNVNSANTNIRGNVQQGLQRSQTNPRSNVQSDAASISSNSAIVKRKTLNDLRTTFRNVLRTGQLPLGVSVIVEGGRPKLVQNNQRQRARNPFTRRQVVRILENIDKSIAAADGTNGNTGSRQSRTLDKIIEKQSSVSSQIPKTNIRRNSHTNNHESSSVRISQKSAVPKIPTILLANKKQNTEARTSSTQNLASRAVEEKLHMQSLNLMRSESRLRSKTVPASNGESRVAITPRRFFSLGHDNIKRSHLDTIDQSPAFSVQTQIIRNAPVEASNMRIISRDQTVVETEVEKRLREIKSRLGVPDEGPTTNIDTNNFDPHMLQLHDKINNEQTLMAELQLRQDNGQTSEHSLGQTVDGNSPATAKLLADIAILRNILQQMQTLNVHRENQQNVHIDQTLINSVPVMNNIGSAGHVTDTSSAFSGQHSDHVLPVQKHSPQAIPSHFNGYQTVPENMILNAQEIGTPNVYQESLQNVHIDQTLINSVPAEHDIWSGGHMADTSSTFAGRHSDHIMSVQQNLPQTLSGHVNDHQTVPETMMLNALQIDTSNVHQHANKHQENLQNVHIDNTLMNSVAGMHGMTSVGHMADASSILSGRHSKHVQPVQKHAPQTVSSHFIVHQTVPENMLLNAQQIDTPNVHQGSQQNVHIDHTSINSVPVVNGMASVGHLADTSSTLSGRHSDHIMSAQQNSPQTLLSHLDVHQSVPETMVLNSQVQNNNLELLQAVSQQNIAPSVPLIADTSALNRHLHTTVHHGIGNARIGNPLSTHNSVLLQQIINSNRQQPTIFNRNSMGMFHHRMTPEFMQEMMFGDTTDPPEPSVPPTTTALPTSPTTVPVTTTSVSTAIPTTTTTQLPVNMPFHQNVNSAAKLNEILSSLQKAGVQGGFKLLFRLPGSNSSIPIEVVSQIGSVTSSKIPQSVVSAGVISKAASNNQFQINQVTSQPKAATHDHSTRQRQNIPSHVPVLDLQPMKDMNIVRTNKIIDRTTGLKSEQQMNTIKSSHIAKDGKQQSNNINLKQQFQQKNDQSLILPTVQKIQETLYALDNAQAGEIPPKHSVQTIQIKQPQNLHLVNTPVASNHLNQLIKNTANVLTKVNTYEQKVSPTQNKPQIIPNDGPVLENFSSYQQHDVAQTQFVKEGTGVNIAQKQFVKERVDVNKVTNIPDVKEQSLIASISEVFSNMQQNVKTEQQQTASFSFHQFQPMVNSGQTAVKTVDTTTPIYTIALNPMNNLETSHPTTTIMPTVKENVQSVNNEQTHSMQVLQTNKNNNETNQITDRLQRIEHMMNQLIMNPTTTMKPPIIIYIEPDEEVEDRPVTTTPMTTTTQRRLEMIRDPYTNVQYVRPLPHQTMHRPHNHQEQRLFQQGHQNTRFLGQGQNTFTNQHAPQNTMLNGHGPNAFNNQHAPQNTMLNGHGQNAFNNQHVTQNTVIHDQGQNSVANVQHSPQTGHESSQQCHPNLPNFSCEGVGMFKTMPSIDAWCVSKCVHGHCVESVCKCGCYVNSKNANRVHEIGNEIASVITGQGVHSTNTNKALTDLYASLNMEASTHGFAVSPVDKASNSKVTTTSAPPSDIKSLLTSIEKLIEAKLSKTSGQSGIANTNQTVHFVDRASGISFDPRKPIVSKSDFTNSNINRVHDSHRSSDRHFAEPWNSHPNTIRNQPPSQWEHSSQQPNDRHWSSQSQGWNARERVGSDRRWPEHVQNNERDRWHNNNRNRDFTTPNSNQWRNGGHWQNGPTSSPSWHNSRHQRKNGWGATTTQRSWSFQGRGHWRDNPPPQHGGKRQNKQNQGGEEADA